MGKYHLSAGTFLSLAFVLALLPTISRGQPIGDTDIVPAGPDMFVTQPGTFFVIPGIGQVNFLGVPNAQGADTIVQRLSAIDVPDVAGATQTIDTKMTLLDLKSTAPVNIGGSFFDVFVTLNPNIASTGTLMLTQTINGEGVPEGTYISTLNVNFVLTFEQNGNAVACPLGAGNCDQLLSLTGNGLWTDDLGIDWIIGPVNEKKPNGGRHRATLLPEPSSLMLMGAGLLGGALCKRLF